MISCLQMMFMTIHRVILPMSNFKLKNTRVGFFFYFFYPHPGLFYPHPGLFLPWPLFILVFFYPPLSTLFSPPFCFHSPLFTHNFPSSSLNPQNSQARTPRLPPFPGFPHFPGFGFPGKPSKKTSALQCPEKYRSPFLKQPRPATVPIHTALSSRKKKNQKLRGKSTTDRVDMTTVHGNDETVKNRKAMFSDFVYEIPQFLAINSAMVPKHISLTKLDASANYEVFLTLISKDCETLLRRLIQKCADWSAAISEKKKKGLDHSYGMPF